MRFKRWVVAATLLIVIALGSVSLHLTNRASRDLLRTLEQARLAIQSGNWVEAAAQAQAMHDDWHKRRSIVQIFISHRDTDPFDSTLCRLIAAIESENKDNAMREIADADTELHNLPARESPSLSNIL